MTGVEMSARVRISQLTLALGLAALSVVLSSCEANPTSPTDQPFTITELKAGTGAIALSGDLLAVHYTGWLYDPSRTDGKGGVFDTSRSENGVPFVFTLGAGEVIAGWDQGLVGMSVGSIRRLVIPPSLGYGSTRNGPVPGYSTLIFEIELVGIGQEPVPE
jgi:FKBP-type peptidyl-prolyl cis-trans isomerase